MPISELRNAAEAGDSGAQIVLAFNYRTGSGGVSKDPIEAIKWCRKAAEQGNEFAQYMLGFSYYYGNGLNKDLAEAYKWLYLASVKKGKDTAEKNSAGIQTQMDQEQITQAQNDLGLCYFSGKGATKDLAEAVKWFCKAAERGYANAQYNLGVCYAQGNGVAKDIPEAVKWCRMAADQGHINAQCDLGVFYEKGDGISKDAVEAVKWYHKAADQGNALAQFLLGVMYYDGMGAPKDFETAAKWIRKSAEQGNVNAQFVLGGMYSCGKGVPENFDEATKWFQKAAEQGHQEAQKIQASRPTEEQRNEPSFLQQTPVQALREPVATIPDSPPSQIGSILFRLLGACVGVVILFILTKGHPFSAPSALIAAIALNGSLVSSLYQIFHPATYLATLPSVFFSKHKPLTPLYVAATINQLLLLGLCFVYFKILIAIGAYVLGLFIMVVIDKILGRLKWLGVYVYPVLVLILTLIAFKQMP
jgi:TPR repeat protein